MSNPSSEKDMERYELSEISTSNSSLFEETTEIDKLGKEMELLRKEVGKLQVKLESTEGFLSDQREENAELRKTRQALSEEIMDLTKALFEEANGMVAEQAKARAVLEVSRRKLEAELETTKEQLRLEKQQLFELRDRFTLDSHKSDVNGPFCRERLLDAIEEHQYFSCLLPEFRVNTRQKCASASGKIWDQISMAFEHEDLREFSKFVSKLGEMSAEDMLSHPFLKGICETDVAPCLNFEFKPRPFAKKIALAILKNTCNIERVKTTDQSPTHSSSSIDDGASTMLTADLQMITLDVDYGASMPAPAPSIAFPGSPSSPAKGTERLRGIMNHFTMSVSSLPESLLPGSTPKTPVKLDDIPKTTRSFCSLCGRKERLKYRFRLCDRESWNVIDKYCRQRLVAAGHLFTFIRHLKSDLHSNRPILDLYYDLLHYRRLMFYSRVDRAATMFYLQSDYEAFLRLIENKINEQPIQKIEASSVSLIVEE